jgi:hypothetical protein
MPTRERRLAELARAQASPGTEVALVPLYVTPQAAEALEEACAHLQQNPRLYRDVELALMHLQRGKYGPLTALLGALVGHEDEEHAS